MIVPGPNFPDPRYPWPRWPDSPFPRTPRPPLPRMPIPPYPRLPKEVEEERERQAAEQIAKTVHAIAKLVGKLAKRTFG